MLNNKRLSIFLVFTLVVTLLLSVSCTPQKRPAPRDTDPGAGDTRIEERTDRERTQDIERNNEANRKAARMAQTIANEIEEVNSATVVFADEVAYVGIDLKAKVPDARAEEIKKEIAGLIKRQDPDVDTVYVTEDADTFTRLQEIAQDIENGRPLSGFLDELETMFKRVTPSMD